MNIIDTIAAYWQVIITTLGISWASALGIAYLWFKKWGETWIETKIKSKFDTEGEKLKHELNKELEAHKVQLSMTAKQREKEFDVLSEIWSKAKDAEGAVRDLLHPLQTYVDVSKYSDVVLEEFLIKEDFNEDDRGFVHAAPRNKRNEAYQEKLGSYRIREVQKSVSACHNYAIKNIPFIPKNISNKVLQITRHYNGALLSFNFGKQAKDYKMQRAAFNEAFPNGDKEVNELGDLIQKRFQGK